MTEAQTDRVKVARTDDLSSPGAVVISEVRGQEIAVFNVDNEFFAMANYCVHQGGPLCEGELTGNFTFDSERDQLQYDETERIVKCPWHNWRFDVTTGRSVDDKRYQGITYEVNVEDGDIFVQL
jgi:nitrite reductase/ring-hydroxylating ferredoxin subunit